MRNLRNMRTSHLIAYGFLAPTFVLLGGLIIWPALATIYRSFFDAGGEQFTGGDNYVELFSQDRLRKAVFNTFIWVTIFPAFTTVVGLVLAVLTEKIRARSAFRLLLFMPAAIALLSSGIIWRMVYDDSPDQGVLNGVLNAPVSVLRPEGPLNGAKPSTETSVVEQDGQLVQVVEVRSEGTITNIGLLGFPESQVKGSTEAIEVATAKPGTLQGVAWRDISPSGGERGTVDAGELGLNAIEIQLIDDKQIVETVQSNSAGRFSFEKVPTGTYQLAIAESEFREPWGGVGWLGPSLITLSMLVAGIWVWGGFATLVIASGLASIPKHIFEAARIDGASEWNIFRFITFPLLKPTLGVVFISLTIHALKMFDLVIGIAPESVQDEANTVALEMWRTSFTGLGNKGLGSAIAVFLFLLALPIMALNIRRFKLDEAAR